MLDDSKKRRKAGFNIIARQPLNQVLLAITFVVILYGEVLSFRLALFLCDFPDAQDPPNAGAALQTHFQSSPLQSVRATPSPVPFPPPQGSPQPELPGEILTGSGMAEATRGMAAPASYNLPLRSSRSSRGQVHVALLADPQLSDAYSYGQSEGIGLTLMEFYSDLYMRRAWSALRRRGAADAVFLLGDLFDGGYVHSDARYNRQLARFHWLFSGPWSVFPDGVLRPDLPIFNISGNHDIGMGPRSLAPSKAARFQQHFGPLNYAATVGNFTIVVVCAPCLEPRHNTDSPYAPFYQETVAFVDSLAAAEPTLPRILLTHVPLYREPHAPCGPLRRPHNSLVDRCTATYCNMLSRDVSRSLLTAVRPVHVFSGDDHMHCRHMHSDLGNDLPEIPEDTVGTFSWLQGNTAPSLLLLSLANPTGHPLNSGRVFHAVVICFLPWQVYLYLSYAALAVGALTAHWLHLRSQPQYRKASWKDLLLEVAAQSWPVFALGTLEYTLLLFLSVML